MASQLKSWVPEAVQKLDTAQAAGQPARQKCANKLIHNLNDLVHGVYRRSIGTKKVSDGTVPFWSAGLKVHKKRLEAKVKCLAAIGRGVTYDPGLYYEVRSLPSLRADFRRLIRRYQRASLKQTLEKKLTSASRTKEAWKAINSVKGGQHPPLTGSSGERGVH